jgi:RNA polymerase sigma factor (sigma-70 family)
MTTQPPVMTTPPPVDPRSDAALIKACQNGDAQAFRGLYRRHQRFVRSTLQHLCDPTTLDDLVQEVFLRAWKGLASMRQDSQFSTWLYRIAWNVGADYRRRMAQSRSHQAQLSELSSELSSEVPSTSWQGLHHQDLVRRGLKYLKDDQAMIVILNDLQELPQPEIARILDIPVGTVKSRLFHARASLRQFFKKEGVSL